MSDAWHRGTRYWKLAGDTIVLLFLALYIALAWRPEQVSHITGVLLVFLPVVFGGAAVVKHKQSNGGGS